MGPAVVDVDDLLRLTADQPPQGAVPLLALAFAHFGIELVGRALGCEKGVLLRRRWRVGGVARWRDRSMTPQHLIRDRRPREQETAQETLNQASLLWGYDVKLESTDSTGKTWALYELTEDESHLDVFIDDDV